MGVLNVGKFSFLNVIVGWDVVIVMEEVGMIWDVIEVYLDLGGYFVILIDIVGLCDIDGVVEKEGICCVQERGCQVDLILWVVELGGVEMGDLKVGLLEDVKDEVLVWIV